MNADLVTAIDADAHVCDRCQRNVSNPTHRLCDRCWAQRRRPHRRGRRRFRTWLTPAPPGLVENVTGQRRSARQ